MTRTAIETADLKWDPITGCEHDCKAWFGFDCWAQRGMARQRKDFAPRVMLDRLHEPLDRTKPAIVAACWQGDLFGDWQRAEHIKLVLAIASACPHLTFQFLTKNPRRLVEFSPYPANCWVGASVPRQIAHDNLHQPPLWADVRQYFPKIKAAVRFVSFEPLLGPILLPDKKARLPFEWAIIGGLSGERLQPATVWSERQLNADRLSMQLGHRGIPHYVKGNLAMPCLPREWPHGFEPPTRRKAE
jgi:protein gp37